MDVLQPAQTASTPALQPQLVDVPVFNRPSRPNLGLKGRPIILRANHFHISMPRGFVHHYNIYIQPDNCPRMVNHEIICAMVSAYSQVFDSVRPVYDGRNNFFTKDPLPIGKDKVELEVTLPGGSKDRIFCVYIKWLSQISLFALEEALEGRTRQIPYDTIFALDVIIRYFPLMTYTPVGRSFFFPPEGNYHSLSGGREIWHGFHQSVKPSKWKLMLNIDVTATAFHKAQSMIEFMCELLNIQNIRNQRKTLSDAQILKFAKVIKGFKIEVTHCGKMRRKYKVCNVTSKSAKTLTFPLQLENGQTVACTVAKYFLDKYKIKLRYSYLPCLHVGQEHGHIYLPIEICNLIAGQPVKNLNEIETSSMIETTIINAPDREQEINSLIRQANLNNGLYLQEFGLTISNNMMEVRGRILPPPKLQYGRTLPDQKEFHVQQILPQQGFWDMRGKQFFTGVEIRIWALVCFVSQNTICENELKNFITQLQTISNEAGMPLVGEPCYCKYAKGIDSVEPMFNYLKSTFTGLQLLIIVLPGKTRVYAEVKRVGDNVLGIATQCVQAKNVTSPSFQVFSNLCLKINAKLGGINSILVPSIRSKVFNEPLLFLGASIFHPSVYDINNQSIAAVVGSMDAHPSRYTSTVLLQQYRQENIQELSSMVKDLLIMFYKSTGGFKPHRVILYRDGVTEKQFSRVLQYELAAIREACLKLEVDYKPGITYIIVQKQHHTRLFCADKKEQFGKSGNIPAGTIVDVGITHPTEFDFYLCSHQVVQGTSRPSHYYVLWDDNNFESDELQNLTYQLCYTYVRCTRSVSIPAPLYYAHLVTLRARYHLAKKEDCFKKPHKSGCGEDQTLSVVEHNIQVHAESKKVMYFA
ncbi:unnamed protein product [Aphis gossypii]|uniref:Protein argonaute-2 n=1 Tax=Aphis gossypii TaxID=80765 RepID=A0A9P0JA39_APHGO|nr:unnamed protein product [Aphis gossypii]